MSGEIKLCRDCKWLRRQFLMPLKLSKCANPLVNINKSDFLVDGESKVYASAERIIDLDMGCGKSGKLWEAKI